ncbi:MAG: F0F1 ATP synthase subunit B [Phycisphaera sp.]|nr:F0F1 ATP synthase subunit B [Phycisphaera sp.]
MNRTCSRIFPLMVALATTATAYAADAEHGGEHSAEPSLFAGTIMQSVAAVIVFVLLFAVLYRLAWGPILKGLQDREGKIKADLEAAEKSNRDAAEKLKQLEAQLAAAQQKAAELIDEARKDAQKTASRIEEDARKEIDALRQRSTNEIKFAKETALNEIYQQAAVISTQIASRVLKREVKEEDHRQLVQEVLGEFKG